MREITVMTSKKELPTLGGRGSETRENHLETSRLVLLTKTKEYGNPEYCLGCAYFQQVKGHYGFCKGALDPKLNPTNKYYDGTKKGTGCSLYRTNFDIPDNIDIVKITKLDQIRRERNEKIKLRRIRIRRSYNKQYKRHGLNDFKEVYHELPYQRTSDIHVKRAYTNHRYNKHIIDFVLNSWMNEKRDYNEIIQKAKRFFGVELSKQTIYSWVRRFLGKQTTKNQKDPSKPFCRFIKMVESNLLYETLDQTKTTTCKWCGSKQIRRYGIKYNLHTQVQRFVCSSCKRYFVNTGIYYKKKHNPLLIKKAIKLVKDGLSLRQTRNVILKESHIKISHVSILEWLTTYEPNFQLPQNRPVREETKQKLRIATINHYQRTNKGKRTP